MKDWEYYSTPESHPWVGSEEIEAFRDSLPVNLPEVSKRYASAQFVWASDDKTKSELSSLEKEFVEDTCRELGISEDQYHEIDPYDGVIGCPENHEYPTPSQFEEMYEYVKNKLEH